MVDESVASANLDQANEVVANLATHGPSKTEVMEAMHQASYFHIPQAELEQLAAVQAAEARLKKEAELSQIEDLPEIEASPEEEAEDDTEEEDGGGLLMIGAFLVAILLGQAVRIVFF